MLQRVLVDPPSDLTPIQRLACAVVRQALLDATRGVTAHLRNRRRWEAQRLRSHQTAADLRADEGLRIWCWVAGLDPDLVFARLQRL